VLRHQRLFVQKYWTISWYKNLVFKNRPRMHDFNSYFPTQQFFARLFEEKKSSYCRHSASGSVKFFVRVHFSKTIKGIHLKLGILVHYQKRNQLQLHFNSYHNYWEIVFLAHSKSKRGNNSNKMLDGVVFSCQQIGVNTFL
jgi:hypothetical protein